MATYEQLTDPSTQATRQQILSWMIGLCMAANQRAAAEGHLLELLAWAAFSDRNGSGN